MNIKQFSDAMSEIDGKYIDEACFYHAKAKRHGRASAVLVAAAVLIVLIVGCGVVTTMIYGDSIQDWFQYYWNRITGQAMSEEQLAVLDGLSQEIHCSQTSGGLTVTVDSATMGDNCFFLLLRVEGAKLSERYSYRFGESNVELSPEPVNGNGDFVGMYGFQYLGKDGDGAALFLMDFSFSSGEDTENTSPLEVRLTLKQFVRVATGNKTKVLSDGEWSYVFSLDRSSLPESISLPDAEVQIWELRTEKLVPLSFSNIQLTNTSLWFECDFGNETVTLAGEIRVLLENGLTIPANSGGHTPLPEQEKFRCSYQWVIPVNLEEVTGVQVGETLIPVSGN